MTDDKKFVYLPVELADQVESIGSDKVLSAVIEKYFEESMRDIKANLETLDDMVLQYKGLMSKAREEFRTASNDMVEKSYKTWEEFDAKTPVISRKVKAVCDELKPIHKSLTDLDTLINRLDFRHLERILDVVERVANMTPEAQKVMGFLIENWGGW